MNPFDGNITFIGVVLESLPVDVKACCFHLGGGGGKRGQLGLNYDSMVRVALCPIY